MSETIVHLRIKKEYGAALIEDLIKVDALEEIERENFELTTLQKEALDKELASIESDKTHLQKWSDVTHRFEKR
jgi:hypothetical protein